MNAFPFGIADVCRLCKIPTSPQQKHNEYTDCPFCGRKKKLNINYQKNQFRCPACGVGGSMLRLYSLCTGFEGDNGKIVAKIKKSLGIANDYQSATAAYIPTKRVEEKLDVDFEHIDHCDKVYRAFLEKLGLGSVHYKRLKYERYMDDEDINRFLFKSVPLLSYPRICSELISEGYNLEGVGGFYYDTEIQSWSVALNPKISGYIIPVWGFFGKIQGLQVRLDKPYGGYKYHLVSSDGYNKGTKTTAVPFFVGGAKPRKAHTLVVTEGFFKAAIPNKLYSCDVMALFGVNNQKEFERLIPYIKEKGYTEIVEAFDSDYVHNKNVMDAKNAFHKLVEDNGFKLTVFTWDPSFGKGLDDYCINKKCIENDQRRRTDD